MTIDKILSDDETSQIEVLTASLQVFTARHHSSVQGYQHFILVAIRAMKTARNITGEAIEAICLLVVEKALSGLITLRVLLDAFQRVDTPVELRFGSEKDATAHHGTPNHNGECAAVETRFEY